MTGKGTSSTRARFRLLSRAAALAAEVHGSRFNPREGRAITILARIGHQFPRDRILVNVLQMMQEILLITNSVGGKSALPEFAFSSENSSEGMRVSTLDQLYRMLERRVLRRSQ